MTERLTLNKAIDEMGMRELAHNCCYVKDGAARYRDFDTNIDARAFVRDLMVEYGHWKSCEKFGLDADNELVDDDIYDETMLENLMYDPKESIGLIALFYRNLWAMADLHNRLKHYEDLEEQGLLLKLPCKVGNTVYVLCECGMIPQQLDGTFYSADGSPGTATGYYCPYEDNCPHDCEENEDIFDCDKFRQKSAVFEDTVKSITLENETIYISTGNCAVYSPIGYAVFLTQAEADEALRK